MSLILGTVLLTLSGSSLGSGRCEGEQFLLTYPAQHPDTVHYINAYNDEKLKVNGILYVQQPNLRGLVVIIVC